MALVDDESVLRDRLGVNFVGVQQVDEFGFGRSGLGGWHESKVVCCGTRGNLMSNVSQDEIKQRFIRPIPFGEHSSHSILE